MRNVNINLISIYVGFTAFAITTVLGVWKGISPLDIVIRGMIAFAIFQFLGGMIFKIAFDHIDDSSGGKDTADKAKDRVPKDEPKNEPT